MRVTTPAVNEPGFIALCIQLAQATFSEVMPSKADPKTPASPVRAPKERGWMTALGNWFHRQEVKNREAYLAQSTDVFDLERRIRYLERRAYY
jgi:Protein of unknown function (DUF3563)